MKKLGASKLRKKLRFYLFNYKLFFYHNFFFSFPYSHIGYLKVGGHILVLYIYLSVGRIKVHNRFSLKLKPYFIKTKLNSTFQTRVISYDQRWACCSKKKRSEIKIEASFISTSVNAESFFTVKHFNHK